MFPPERTTEQRAIGLHGLVDCSDRCFGHVKAELFHIGKYTYIGFHFATLFGS